MSNKFETEWKFYLFLGGGQLDTKVDQILYAHDYAWLDVGVVLI